MVSNLDFRIIYLTINLNYYMTDITNLFSEQFFSYFTADGKSIYSFVSKSDDTKYYFDNPNDNPCCLILGVDVSTCNNCPLQRSILSNQAEEQEYLALDNQWWLISAAPAFDVNGICNGSFLSGKNITSYKHQRAEKEISESNFQLLFENSQEAIFVIQEGKIKTFNQKFCEITGYSREEIADVAIIELFDKRNSFSTYRKIVKLIRGNYYSQPFELKINNKHNTEQWVLLTSLEITWNNQSAVLAFANDITTKTIATNLLEKRDAQYKLLVENQRDLLVNIDQEGRFIYVSPSYCEMFGRKESELLGKSSMPLVHIEDRLITEVEFEKLKYPPYTSYIQHRAYSVNGWRWLAWSYKSIQDKYGNITSVIGVGRDIHEQKLSEIALLESERRLATLMSNLPGMVYRCKNDRSWTMEFVSNGCYDLTGYSSNDLINNSKVSFNDVIHPDFREEVWKNWQIAIEKKQVYVGEYKIVTSSGKIKWVFEQGQGIYNAYGSLTALEGFIQDITSRKLADEELSYTSEKYRNLIDSALVGIYTTSLEGELIFANDALSSMLGYTAEEAYKMNDILHLYKNIEDRNSFIRELHKHKKLTNVEMVWIHKSGAEVNVLLRAVLSDKYLSGMVMDITHLKRNELELYKAKEKAIESDKLKSAFLSNISHEIRTPVNGIMGFIDIILDKETTEDEKLQYTGLIRKMSTQLLSIMNDLIEISKIESNQIIIHKSDFRIGQCLKAVFDQHQKNAEKSGNTLVLFNSTSENEMLYSDEGYIKQIFSYLIDNALKFTNKGIVEFGCKSEDDNIRFYVKDNGIGIHPRNHKLIFERFRQIEDSLTRKYSGSGLGLAISKALVELLGGSISLISEEGFGSEFYFLIPTSCQDKPASQNFNQSELFQGKTVLVCDDDDFGYLYLRKILTKSGFMCIRADDGQSSIEMHNNTPNIDVIIMDLRMPGISGIEAAIKIREKDTKVPILGYTAYAEDDIGKLDVENIFNGFIFKPIDVPSLLALLKKTLK